MESDDDFAARMRARRGDPPPRRVPAWKQLMQLSIDNVHEMIMRPAIVHDDGSLDELADVEVLSDGDAANAYTGEFAVHTKLVTNGDLEDATVERRLKRVQLKPKATAWLLKDGSVTDGEWPIVEFRTRVYEAMVEQVRMVSERAALIAWLAQMRSSQSLLAQHTHPSWHPLSPVGWTIESVEVPPTACESDEIEGVPVKLSKDLDLRATFTLAKPLAWVDHDGKVATPWGVINCAHGAPVIIEGSALAKRLDDLTKGTVAHIPIDEWKAGLTMPSFDTKRIERILAAQRVLIEVPLAA